MQDATVQSIQPTSPTPVAVAPSSYVAAAPVPVAQPQAQIPVGMNYPQQAPAGPINYPSSPSQYVPQSQPAAVPPSNPWEAAFNKVVGALSQPAPSPFQAAPSAPAQTYPQAIPGNWAQAEAISPGISQSDRLTWSPNQVSSPNYSPTSSTLYGRAAAEAHAEVDGAIADYYNLSPESRAVLNAFGPEAPGILNNYAVNLEKLLDDAVIWAQDERQCLTDYADYAIWAHDTLCDYAAFAVNEHVENKAYNEILTNPDVLSDYTLQFFGPKGPYPVYESEQQLETRGYPTAVQPTRGAAMPAPPVQSSPQNTREFWNVFDQQMINDPQNAWRILNQANPGTMANKLFVME